MLNRSFDLSHRGEFVMNHHVLLGIVVGLGKILIELVPITNGVSHSVSVDETPTLFGLSVHQNGVLLVTRVARNDTNDGVIRETVEHAVLVILGREVERF